MIDETRADTPTKTVVIGHDRGDQKVSYGYYRPAKPGDPIELSPPLEPGTWATVMEAYVSKDDPSVFVIEIGNMKTLTPGAPESAQ